MKIIPGYSSYQATKDGRVWSNRLRKGWLTPVIDKNSYHDKSNNHVDNLVWCTHRENIQHDWANDKRPRLVGEAGPGHKITEKQAERVIELYAEGNTQMSLSKLFGISQPTISQIIRGVTWRHLL